MNRRQHLPVAVHLIEVVALEGEAGAGSQLRQVALGLGGGGLAAQRLEADAGKGRAGGIRLVAARVVIVIIVVPLSVLIEPRCLVLMKL
ncbi:hypothetical protein GCM10008997_29520 [Halomonas salifodinae]